MCICIENKNTITDGVAQHRYKWMDWTDWTGSCLEIRKLVLLEHLAVKVLKETNTKWYQYTSQFSEKVCTANDAYIENQYSCTNYVKHFYRHVHKFNLNAGDVLHIIGIYLISIVQKCYLGQHETKESEDFSCILYLGNITTDQSVFYDGLESLSDQYLQLFWAKLDYFPCTSSEIFHAPEVRANRECKHNHSTFSTRANVLLNAMYAIYTQWAME